MNPNIRLPTAMIIDTTDITLFESISISQGGFSSLLNDVYTVDRMAFDWLDPNKNGFNNAMDPNKNGAADAFNPDKNGFNNAMDPNKNGFNNAFDPSKNGFNNAMKDVGKTLLPIILQIPGVQLLTKIPIIGPLIGGGLDKLKDILGLNTPKTGAAPPPSPEGQGSEQLLLLGGGAVVLWLALR